MNNSVSIADQPTNSRALWTLDPGDAFVTTDSMQPKPKRNGAANYGPDGDLKGGDLVEVIVKQCHPDSYETMYPGFIPVIRIKDGARFWLPETTEVAQVFKLDVIARPIVKM